MRNDDATHTLLLTQHTDGILVLTINNPAARNALHPTLFDAIPHELARAEADESIGAIILTGAGQHFCAGGDLSQLAARQAMTLSERRVSLERLNTLIRTIRQCGKPVIACVEGAAAGAGFSIAMACDLLVASRSAVFSAAYVKIGLTPDGGITHALSACLPRQMVNELCMTGQTLTGEALYQWRMVNRLTEPGAALPQAMDLARQLASGPKLALQRIKRLCDTAHDSTFDTQLEYESRAMAQSLGSTEAKEGIAAFKERRAARFRCAPADNAQA